MAQNDAANRKATSSRNACAANRICESGFARAMARPPSIAPTRKAKSAVNERAMDNPDTCAVANARSTIFPVMFAVKTCPRDRKLTASTASDGRHYEQGVSYDLFSVWTARHKQLADRVHCDCSLSALLSKHAICMGGLLRMADFLQHLGCRLESCRQRAGWSRAHAH